MLDKIIIISYQGKKLNCNMCSGFSLVRKYFYVTHIYTRKLKGRLKG